MLDIKVMSFPLAVDTARVATRKFGIRTITRMAAYTRAVEQNSMREAPKGVASSPGNPPNAHPRGRTRIFRNFIRFDTEGTVLEPSAVVGPTTPKFSGEKHHNLWAERIGKTHEFGGTVTQKKNVRYIDGRSKGIVLWGKDRKPTFEFEILETTREGTAVIYRIQYKAFYPKRPFAAPALAKTVAAGRAGKFD